MSATTAAIPISTPNTNQQLSLDSNTGQDVRKRIVAVTKKKPSPEINGSSPNNNMIVPRQDLSHTMRGEAVIERPRDTLDTRRESHNNNNNNTDTILMRKKRVVSKPARSNWQILSNLLFKGCVIIMVIIWISQSVYKWIDGKPIIGSADPESRLSNVESSLTKTTKYLQAQLDVMDKKIGSEINNLKIDLNTKVQHVESTLKTEITSLESKTNQLDQSLSEIQQSDFLSKREFEGFIEEFKKNKGLDDKTDKETLNLDEMRLFAREMVAREIENHAADGLGIVDYALFAGGARVVRHSEPYLGTSGGGGKTNWFASRGVHPRAQKMLEPSFGEPGQCFALKGDKGFVEIKLRTGIIPQAVTLEHVDKSVAYDRSSAPRYCQVSGWYEGPDEQVSVLTEFTYSLDKSNSQTFNVESADSRVINMVRLEILSNHGSSSLTCIYRFRVHGFEPGAPSAITLQA